MYPKRWISPQKASSLLRSNLPLVKRGKLYPVMNQTMMCGHIHGQGYYLTPANKPTTVHEFMVAVCGPDYAQMELGKRDAMVIACADHFCWELRHDGPVWTLRREIKRKLVVRSFDMIGQAVKFLLEQPDTE